MFYHQCITTTATMIIIINLLMVIVMIETNSNNDNKKKIDLMEMESYLPKESFDSFDPDILLRRSNHSIYVQYISTMTTTIMIDMNENQLSSSSSSSSSSLIINQLRAVPTSDGQIRQYWLKDFQKIDDNIALKTNGRIRMFEDELSFRAVEYNDSGIYTCADISNINGVRFLHFRLFVRSYNSNWLEISNPIAVMKVTLLFTILCIILPWILYRYQNFDRKLIRKYYVEMKVTKSMLRREKRLIEY
uniref:Uncharacterized protein LOC113792189 n=1 Tax=Dermatophagoides pteronyssinus TaxID=6956 RepID=A0A6P6XXM7_DERPT|nr:uncharacterized protein LOC113792189 [Dermatophagoides pteronyssinus]